MTWLPWVYLFVGAAALGLVVRGNRAITRLGHVAPVPLESAPRVSVVVAARDEAAHVEKATRALLGQDYPDLEVIVVDDRSTDGTGDILDRLAAEHASLKVVHITVLPAGWLGKNHALQCGADAAAGEFVLFTDADVMFTTGTIRRAVAFAQAHALDHLAVAPSVMARSVSLRAFIGAFTFFFTLYAQPWRARNPRDAAYIGIGAFNMVRRRTYEAAGGHSALRLRPDDDMMLGKRLKQCGARQDLVFGHGFVSVEWYPSFRALVDGLMKNMFPGLNYSILATLGSVAAQVVFHVGPFVAVPFFEGPARLVCAAAALLLATAAGACARAAGLPAWLGLTLPLSAVAFSYILLRSMCLTLWQGGVVWRGTLYPLSELRRNRV